MITKANTIQIKTANYTITDNEVRGSYVFTNEWATGTVIFTLPNAEAGSSVKFIVKENFTIQIDASWGNTINGSANYSSGNVWDVITVYATNNSEWILEAANQNSNSNSSSSTTSASLKKSNRYMLWEDWTRTNNPPSVFVENMVSFSEADQIIALGNTSENTRISIPVFGSGVSSDELNLSLRKYISPSVDLWIRIESDDNWIPSGNLIDPNATASVTSWSLTTSLVDTTITLSWAITIPEWTKAHIVLFPWTYGSETINASNYFGIWYDDKNTTTRAYDLYWPLADISLPPAWVNNSQYINSLYKENETFPPSTLPSWRSSIWTSPSVNNYLEYNWQLSSTYNFFNRYSIYNSVDLSSYNEFAVQAEIIPAISINTGNVIKWVLGLYIDNNNYFLFWVRFQPGVSILNYAKFVVWWSTVYEDTATDVEDQVKFVYDWTDIKIYRYETSAWVLYHTYTYTINNPCNVVFTAQTGWVANDQISVRLSDLYITNYDYATQYPWALPTLDRDKFLYTTSDLFTPELLSKTDAKYDYKLPQYLPMFLEASALEWTKPTVSFYGLIDNFLGLTKDSAYFIADTPWAISTTPWTNTYGIWQAVDEENIFIRKRAYSYDTSSTVLNTFQSWNWTDQVVYVPTRNQLAHIYLTANTPINASQDASCTLEYSADWWSTRTTLFSQTAPNVSNNVPFAKMYTIPIQTGFHYRCTSRVPQMWSAFSTAFFTNLIWI